MAVTSVLASLLLLYTCQAYPDMECNPPRGTPSTQAFPYDVTLTVNPPDNFNPNVTVTYVIKSYQGRMFRDFQVQARSQQGGSNFQSSSGGFGSSFGGSSFNQNQYGTGNVIGSFQSMGAESRVISCQGYSDTAINSNRDSKQSVNLRWNSPRGFYGQVQFTLTVISIDDQMWENQIKVVEVQAYQGSYQGQQGFNTGQQGFNTGQQGFNPGQPGFNQGFNQGQGINQPGYPNQGGYYPGQQPNQYPGQGYYDPQSTYGYGHDGQYGYTSNPYGGYGSNRYYNNSYSLTASMLSIFFSIIALLFRHYL